jgi:hypothetical protein
MRLLATPLLERKLIFGSTKARFETAIRPVALRRA